MSSCLLAFFAAAVLQDGAEGFDRVREQIRPRDASRWPTSAQMGFHHSIALVPHRDRALHLIAQVLRIDNRAALESFGYTDDLHHAVSDAHLRAGGHIAVFLNAAAEAESLAGLRFLAGPAKGFCRSFENRTQAWIRNIFQTKFERIDFAGLDGIV